MQIGDYIEAYCSHCKRPSDHSVTAVVDDKVKKVRCRTCDYEHSFRAGSGKKEMTNKEAFDKVLASVMNVQTHVPQPPAKTKNKK